MKRKATAVWKGSGLEGGGVLTTKSGAFQEQPYSFKTRFENEDGRMGTNPEELIAAAHAGCFCMALSFGLGRAGYTPDSLETEAVVRMEKGDAGFRIAQITLRLRGKVDGIGKDEFITLAMTAKENCPISQALSAVDITLEAELV
ncbi:MAG: OsmC family protein [Bacteroidetes bacterium]|nr:OsmC family protein [Bacteroidota bacterium]